MKDAITKLIRWFVLSSSNPSQVSLTAKGILIGLVPAAMTLFGAAHVIIGIPLVDSQTVVDVINAAITTLQAVLILIGAALALFGAFRKLWNTVFSSNAVSTEIATTATPPNVA